MLMTDYKMTTHPQRVCSVCQELTQRGEKTVSSTPSALSHGYSCWGLLAMGSVTWPCNRLGTQQLDKRGKRGRNWCALWRNWSTYSTNKAHFEHSVVPNEPGATHCSCLLQQDYWSETYYSFVCKSISSFNTLLSLGAWQAERPGTGLWVLLIFWLVLMEKSPVVFTEFDTKH